MTAAEDKKVFVICPIGGEDSPVRKASDQLMKFIIKPVADELGYAVERADTIMESGAITSQIFNRLVTAPLVIADLTGHNPNVFYELAVRHAVRKPVIHVIAKGETIPFDVATSRTLFYQLELEPVEAAKQSLRLMIESVEKESSDVESPISEALERVQLSRSPEPADRRDSELLSMVSDIRTRLNMLEVEAMPSITPANLIVVEDLLTQFAVLAESTINTGETRDQIISMIDSFFAITEGMHDEHIITTSQMSRIRHPSHSAGMTRILNELTAERDSH